MSDLLKAIEIILVDDGSPDGSGRICDEMALKDNRVRVYHQANEGVTVARRNGLKMAKGKYVCFVDSDDTLPLDALECLLENVGDADMIKGVFANCIEDLG